MDFNKPPQLQAAEITLHFLKLTLDMGTAKECATFFVDGLISFTDFNLKGWLDSDVLNYLKEVKINIANF